MSKGIQNIEQLFLKFEKYSNGRSKYCLPPTISGNSAMAKSREGQKQNDKFAKNCRNE
jgi:hypothetical protein